MISADRKLEVDGCIVDLQALSDVLVGNQKGRLDLIILRLFAAIQEAPDEPDTGLQSDERPVHPEAP